MSTPDANGWFKGLEDAPKDEQIVVVAPYEDEDDGTEYLASVVMWNPSGFWDGLLEDHNGAPEPTHWKRIGMPVECEFAEAAA